MIRHAVTLAAFAFAGLVLAAAYLAALRGNLALYLGRRVLAIALLLHLARLAIVGGAFWLAAQQGAEALLAVAAGFSAARLVGARRLGQPPEVRR